MADHIDILARLGACRDAVEWAKTQPDAATAWATCERGDWMLWIAGRMSGEHGSDARRPLTLAACECARLALPRVKAGEIRPMRAIEAAEDWARGGPTTLAKVRKASADSAAVYAAAAYAVYAAAAYAAYAAAAAAYAAAAAASAAAYAAAALRRRRLRQIIDPQSLRRHRAQALPEAANGERP